MSWEVVTDVRKYRHEPKEPAVEVTRSGLIRFNELAANEVGGSVLGKHENVILLFNPQTSQVGVVPVDSDTAHGLKTETSNERVRVFSLRRTARGASIPAKPLFNRLNLGLDESGHTVSRPEVIEHPEHGKMIAFSIRSILQGASNNETEQAVAEVAASSEEKARKKA